MAAPDVCSLPRQHCRFLDCDERCCQMCLMFNSFDLLKNQNVHANLRVLYRLTMGLCSQLKARHFIVTSLSKGCLSFASILTGNSTLSVFVQEMGF